MISKYLAVFDPKAKAGRRAMEEAAMRRARSVGAKPTGTVTLERVDELRSGPIIVAHVEIEATPESTSVDAPTTFTRSLPGLLRRGPYRRTGQTIGGA